MRAWWLLLPLVVLPACAGGRGHPVRASLPRIPAAEWPAPAPEIPAVADALGAETARGRLVAGLEKLYERLLVVRERATDGAKPAFVRVTQAEASVQRRYRGRRTMPVNQVAVIGTAGRMPLAPAEAAALLLDPEVERQVLAAHRFARVGTRFARPGHRRDVFHVEKLRVGFGAMRYDLRFATAVERMDLGDGRILVRYDPHPWKAATGVSLYRGLLLIEPEGEGSRVTEVVVFGTPLTAPVPFDQILKNLVYETFRHRATNLWTRAYDT